MYAASLAFLCAICFSTAQAKQTFLGVQSTGVNGDNANANYVDANTDSWDTKSSNTAEPSDSGRAEPDSSDDWDSEKAMKPTHNPLAAAPAVFVEPPKVAPPPKTWNELTPAQQQAIKARYAIGQWVNAFFTWLVWTVLGVLVGIFVYTQKSVEHDEKVSASDDGGPEYEFHNGHCACLEDLESCACACLCPALRWADTLQQAGFSKFWLGFLLYTFLALLNCLHWGKLWAGLFTAIGICVMRQRLRAKIGLTAWDMRGCCLDYCFALWCPCCAIAQEARVVQAMQRCGHESLEQGNAESES